MALNSGGGGGGASARAIEAGRAYVRLGGKDDLSGFLNRMKAKLAAFGKALAVGGGLALGGLGLAAGAGLAAINPLVETLQDLTKMDDVAKAFGTTGRAASGLFGVLGAVGGEFKENLEGVIQFADTVEQALKGGDNQGAKLFDGLAVTAKDVAALPIDEKFFKVHEAIRQLPQPLQEAKLALLGGTDSMKQWQRLLAMSNAEVRELAGRMRFSGAELERAAAATRAYERATGAIGRAWQQVAIVVAPLVEQVANRVADVANGFVGWIKGRDLGNVLAEVGVRLKQGLLEAQIFARDSLSAVWDYLTKDSGQFFDVVRQSIQGLVNYTAGTFAKLFPVVTRGLMAAVREGLTLLGTAKLALGDEAGARQIAESLAAMDENRILRDIQAAQERGAAELGEAMKLAGEEWDKLSKRFKESSARNAATDADDRKKLTDELEPILMEAEWQRMEQAFRDLTEEALVPPAAAAQAKQVGQALGTFGDGGKFLGQMFGGGKDLPKQQLAAQQQANALLADIKAALAGLRPLAFD